jgi:4'-phosphopantetheinyl transferase
MQISNLHITHSNIKPNELLPSKVYHLDNNDVIIYTIYVPDFIDLKSDLAKFLNFAEYEKANRFYQEIDKNRFIISRAILKLILAAYSKSEVKNIKINYNINKKPYLASDSWLHFNISHSEDYTVIAISRNEVGIDIEYIAKDFDFDNMLFDIFGEDEILAIQNAGNKKHAFYSSWTRKEAFVKALGKGIDDDFKQIPSLDGEYNMDASLLKTSQKWQVSSFDVATHYLAAIAFEKLPTITPNLVTYTIPNTMKALIEIAYP